MTQRSGILGRSPLARGSPRTYRTEVAVDRSIPACAGEPSFCTQSAPSVPVDPRLRGGAACGLPNILLSCGRSPLARGSLLFSQFCPLYPRSIPACAGEPNRVSSPLKPRAVDPRLRGGACCFRAQIAYFGGRSPLARGSRPLVDIRRSLSRSIPACAGEPSRGGFRSCRETVDPRLRGGAAQALPGRCDRRGRSPLARGSHWGGGQKAVGYRSIPACAGEPGFFCLSDLWPRVDPRLRGGAENQGCVR